MILSGKMLHASYIGCRHILILGDVAMIYLFNVTISYSRFVMYSVCFSIPVQSCIAVS